MPPENSDKTIKITLDDLANVQAPEAGAVAATPALAGTKIYGSINEPADPQTQLAEEKGSILLQAWFYLGLAGFIGALIGWGLCEPWFNDGDGRTWWQSFVLMGLVVTLQCVGFGVAESIVERSAKKALVRGGLAVPLGVVISAVISVFAGLVFAIGTSMVFEMGVQTARNPAFWIARGVAWMVLGVAAGAVYGIV